MQLHYPAIPHLFVAQHIKILIFDFRKIPTRPKANTANDNNANSNTSRGHGSYRGRSMARMERHYSADRVLDINNAGGGTGQSLCSTVECAYNCEGASVSRAAEEDVNSEPAVGIKQEG